MGWSDMLEELLDLIPPNLITKDKQSFGLVCRSWNAIVASSYRQAPCLMINQRSKHTWKVYQHQKFFYKDYPELDNNAVIHCSKHGWWLMSDDYEDLFFFNPSDNRTIEIPSPIGVSYSTITFFHPPTSADCFVVGIHSGLYYVVIGSLKHGEDEWKTYEQRTKRYIFQHFLVKPKGEDVIFAVFGTHDEREVRVYRLVEKPEGFLWEPVEDLGDMVFFVSNTSCFAFSGNAENMANKIYFPRFHGDDLVFYSLKTRKFHTFKGDFSSKKSYGLKRFDFAIWHIPPPTGPQLSEELLEWYPQEDDDDDDDDDTA
ncbi:hypothetical protein MIMGU_mgv1a018876mg [Erythranthe guttata]|uniref:KIB1-4 beta-propeller domain-containing protein n=1 Tax=Erythranthe guttata TaxID=4155 RepID=A0A022QCN0_ERYGU|nr:hypothetical protein MIMGU_mgv1a018876mg [Erythranthe guttata]